MIRAVIFDLDGTLIDAFGAHLRAFNEAAKQFSLPNMPRGFLEKYNGQTGLEIIRQFLKKPYVDKTVRDMAALKRDIFASMNGSGIIPLPGAVELINELSKRGIPLAIASSAREKEIEAALNELGVRSKITAIASADGIKNSKPHPEIFLKAAELLKTPPKECLVFEDSPWGVMAAIAAGMKCIAVATGTTSKADLKKLGPDMVIKNMAVILPPKLDAILKMGFKSLAR